MFNTPNKNYAYNYTNFSKITTQNPNFDEIKDFPKFDNPISKNAAALKNINEVPDFIQQEYEENKFPALSDNLNVVSPDEIESWKNNPIGIVEAWQKNRKFQSLIPYVNSTIDASNSIKAAFIADKVRKGEELTDEQYEVLYDYLHDMKELETRGFTFGGGTVNAVLQSIPYAEEFAIGLMTSAGGVGFASLAQTLTKIGAKKAAQKAIKEEIKNLATKSTMTGVKKKISGETTKKIYQNSMKLPTSQLLKEVGTKEVLKQTGKALPRIVGTSALFSVTKTPQAFLGNLADRQLTTGIYVTDEGDAVFGTPENVALSCMKALGSTTFDAMTETVGWTFAPLIKYFAKPVQKVMPKSFFTSFEKLISSRYGKPASEILHKYGYDGVLEEMGEELLNRFLCQTFGLNDGEYTFDSFMNNVFYKDNPTQWVQEALAFALTGGFAHGVAGSASKIHDEYKKAKQKEFYEKNAGKIGNATSGTVNGVSISVPQLQGHVSYLDNSDSQTHNRVEFAYTPEEFYLDQGFIKIKGSESQAKHELRLELAKNGILKTEADDYLTTLTETEAREELKAYRQYGNISSSVNDEIKKNKEYAQAHEKMYQDNIKNGMSKNFAKKSADIGMFFVNNLAEKLDVSISDALTLNPEVIKTNKRIVFDDNRAKKVATARKQSEVADFFSNPDEVDSYLLNRLSAEELETLTPEQRKELAVDFAMVDYNITDFDSDVQALKDSSDVVPFKLSDENIDLLTENFSTASEEEKLALSSAFDGKATPEEIELLKNSEQNQSETVQKLLQQIIDNQKGIVLYQKGNTYFQTVSSLVGMQYYNTDGSKVVNILNPLDYDYIVNISTGEKIKIEMIDDINVDEIQPQKISSDLPFEVSKKPSDNKKNLIDKLGVKDGKNIQITNINTNETVKINKGTIEKSLSNVNVNNEHYNDFCKIVYNTEFLFKTSQNILSYSDAKINKPTKISRYANIAKIDNKNYLIEFTTKDNGQITLYSVNLLNKETVLPNAYTSKNFSAPNTVNYSISHIQNVFKSKLVEKYNNDYQTAKKNFKKWFGDSKVVDENGQPLVVYHGSPSHDITTFDSGKTLYGEVSKGFNFFTNKKSAYQDSADDYANFAGTNGYRRNGKVYETYLKIQKPLHIKYTSNAMSLYKGDKQYSTPVEYYDTNYKEIKEKYNNGNYDGIIIENTDKNNDDSIIYLVPNSEQIKSVDNRGTFDESDPNIYFQSVYHGMPHRFDEFSTEHIGSGNSIEQRTDKAKYLTDNEVEQLKKDQENFESYIEKLLNNELSHRTQIRVLEHLTSPYDKIVNLKGKKVVITQDVYKKIIDLPNKFNKNHNIDRNRALRLPQLIADPLYILKSNSEGNEHRFVIVTSSKGNFQGQKLSIILNPKNTVAIVSAYDEKIDISKEKKAGRVLYSKKEELSKTILTSKARAINNSNIIIANNSDNFNPAGNTVYQSKNTARGFYQLDKNLITILKDGNVDTVIHEYAHWYLNTLASLEGSSQKVDDALTDIRKFLKNDGSKFSEKQHEKFAKACEKYFYSGYAKNNKLKVIFEDIKNILHSVYDKLFDKDGNPYFAEFTEEDNKHIKELFDDIFAAEKNRVKNVVFDKVNKLEQMISDIKTKENQELAEIEKIRSGIEAEIKESGEIKKDVQALIDDSAKYADRKQNARWKDYNENRQKIAYDIIATAVGIPVKELKQKLHSKNEKTRENIELKIREVSDKLDVAGYAERPDIEEFFGSINFDEIGANQELVDMAMQAIDSKVDFDSELDKELNFFMNRFDYLNNKLQKTKGKQAAYIAEAMLEIFSGMRYESLPAPFTKDLGEKIMHAMEKNDLKDYRNSSLRASDFYGGQVLQKLKQIKLYSAKDGYAIRIDRFHALYAELPYATNAINTIKIIKKINRLIIDDIRQRQKGLIAKEIARQIKVNSKIITTKFGNRKGRFDWKTNSVFFELDKLNHANFAELENSYDDLLTSMADKLAINTDNGFFDDVTDVRENSTVEFSFDKCLKKKFIEYKRSKSLKNVDVQLLTSLLADIIELKEKGRTSKNKEELEKRLQRYDLRNDLSQRVMNNSNGQKRLMKWLATNDSLINLNTMLQICFGADVVGKYSIDQEEVDAQIYIRRHLMSFYNNALKIYNIKSPTKIAKLLWDINGIDKLQKKFRDYENEECTVMEHLFNYKTKEEKVAEIVVNRAEIITLYTWYQNPLLQKRLINQFGEDQCDYLFSKISEEDKRFALLLIDECDSMFEDTNEVMIRSQGLSLEKVENYFPSIVKRHGDAIDNAVLLNVRIGKPSVTKKRVKSEYIAMNPKNPLSIFSSHVDKVASYVCVSEKASFVSEIIGTPDLARAFENAFRKKGNTDGKNIYKKLAEQVAASTFFKYAQSVNTLNKFSKTIADNFIVQAIGWSPKIALGQLLSVINYADGSDITIAEWTKGFARAIADPKGTIDFMFQDEYLQARFYGNGQNESMQALLANYDKWSNLKTFFTSNIRYGDILAICFGGRPYVEHLMKQGLTKEEAFRRFRRKTNEAQQSSLPSTISNYQRLAQSSWANKVFLAFKNTDHQYERKFIEALSGLIRGDVSKSAAIKSILLYRVVNPLLFSYILNQLGLWSLLFGDDDDKIASLQGAGLALLSANLGAYGLLGISLATILSMADRTLRGKGGLYKTEIPLISDVEENSARILSDIKNGELRTETFIGFLVMTLGLGMGVPAQKIYNTGSGIYDITNGEVAVGIAKMLGWSDSVARKTFDD